jgi:endoglucanase
MIQTILLRLVLLSVVSSLFIALPSYGGSVDWSGYKQRFLANDGRIIDTGNQHISHSEGQGFSMLFAVAANDKASFDRIWGWTNKYLKNPKTGLFFWKYNPVAADPIEDKNNASDGDVLIAWALLKAGQKWKDKQYLVQSDRILRSLLKYTMVDYGHKKVMLPGKDGFVAEGHITLNPSYFIFPAWRDFANRTHLYDLKVLIEDAQKLLQGIDWGRYKLPTDWITLYADGHTTPSRQWPTRASYDAIRIPLYIKWDEPNSPLLKPWRQWFGHYSRLKTPAWEDVFSDAKADYMMRGGLLAIRDFTMDDLTTRATQVSSDDDYYSASLKLLSALAEQRF